jgi:hypothetical protein
MERQKRERRDDHKRKQGREERKEIRFEPQKVDA